MTLQHGNLSVRMREGANSSSRREGSKLIPYQAEALDFINVHYMIRFQKLSAFNPFCTQGIKRHRKVWRSTAKHSEQV